MTALVLYTFAAFGLAYILGHSKASLPVRNMLAALADTLPRVVGAPLAVLLVLLECLACSGTWIGFLYGRFGAASIGELHLGTWSSGVALGLFTCGTNFFFGYAMGLLKHE